MQGQVVKLGDKLESGLAKYAVHVEVEQGIGAIGLGPITGGIIKAVVEYGGKEVTEVPEGENFKVAVTYWASNPGAGLTQPWLITITAMSTDGAISGYEHAFIYSDTVTSALDRIEPLGPMPAHDITLRVNLWGNQDIVIIPPCPPQADWLRTS